MASPDIGLFKRRNNPNYLNWLALGDALRIFGDGLRPYAKKEMQAFHSSMLNKLSGDVCNCSCVPGKTNPHVFVKISCRWAKKLGKYHHLNKKSSIPWHQSDSSKWHDPDNGYWEIAKLFMSELGSQGNTVQDPDSTDITGLLNLLCFCKHFKVQPKLVKSVRGWRNKWAHAPNQLLETSDKESAFKELLTLMDDTELMSCQEVQDCRAMIERVRIANVSILEEKELYILKESKHFVEHDMNHEERRKRQKMERHLKKLDERIKTISDFQKSQTGVTAGDLARNIGHMIDFLFICPLVGLFQDFFKNAIKGFWMIVMVLSIIQVGDKSVLSPDSGCPRTIEKSPISRYGFQEFNFSSYLNYKKMDFFGRKWLFQDLEDVFENGRGPPGVLITGEPGSGKSALMAQLICTPLSSLLIHDNIIGYHLCDYSEKGKRDGARFVRNLVDQIACGIPEYSNHVSTNEQVRKELDKRCDSDPVGCFHSAVVGPLRELKKQPDGLRYIFIDALDECFEKDRKSSAIVDILGDKLSNFPPWLKVVLTSRNWTAVTDRLPRAIKRMSLDPTDERNLEDIHSYITDFLFKNSFFMDRLLEAMGLQSTVEGMNALINEMSTRGEGNFLFVKTTLRYLNESEGRINLQSFPTSLYDTYHIFFKRHFGKDNFSRFKVLFEVLLAASSPLKVDEIDSILYLQNLTCTRTSELLRQLSSFLRFGEDGTVRIYHQSFAEWLINMNEESGQISIKKSRGHQYIADYLFGVVEKKNATPHLQELAELARHVSLGGMLQKHLKKMKYMDVSKIRDRCSGRCILHDLAVANKTAPILEVFLLMFNKSAEIPDNCGVTPAFYAVSEGNVDNVKTLINHGVNLDYVVEDICPPCVDNLIDNIIRKTTGYVYYSLVYIAARNGHTEMVKLLIRSGSSFKKQNLFGVTPLHVAACKGHLAVVKLLYQYGAKADVIALHHAAAGNHKNVVEFLLTVARVKDGCLTCKQRNILDDYPNMTIQDIHSSLCETALHAAVSRRHIAVVKLLLSFDKASLECKHHSGKTALMDAVERNDTEMVDLLLNEGASVEAECGDKFLGGAVKKEYCVLTSFIRDEFPYTLSCDLNGCPCGYRALHFCGQHGLWNMAEKLIFERHANVLATACNGFLAADAAAYKNHRNFFSNFNETMVKLIHRQLLIEPFLRLATIGGSYDMFMLLSSGTSANVLEKIDVNGRTLLHDVARWSPYYVLAERWPLRFHPSIGNPDVLFQNIKRESAKRLSIIKFLVQSQRETRQQSWFVNKGDKDGRTALHIAASNGFAGAVKYLTQYGNSWQIKDRQGKTPLLSALDAAPAGRPEFAACSYRVVGDKKFKAMTFNTTTYDETVAHLILLQKSAIKKCNLESLRILNVVIKKQMPISLFQLLKIGVDAGCTIGKSQRPFLTHLQFGREQVSEVFKIFKINVTVKCGLPFWKSELHLMSHIAVDGDVGNFFRSSADNQSLPLQRLISTDPSVSQILNQCRDRDGYLAIHHAVEGGNFDAIEWFVRAGVQSTQTTGSGLTALELSLYFLENLINSLRIPFVRQTDKSAFEISFRDRVYVVGHRQRHRIFEKLLLERWNATKQRGYTVWCNPKRKRLSLLHLAASRGIEMYDFVFKQVVQLVQDLPTNCANKHNVTPFYLAEVFKIDSEVSESDSNPRKSNPFGNDDEMTFQNPDREAEYHIFYNNIYETPDDKWSDLDVYDAASCPGFNDLLPQREIITDRLKQCYNACWMFTSYVYNQSASALSIKIGKDYRRHYGNNEWSSKVSQMSKLLYFAEKTSSSSRFKKDALRASECARDCRCVYIMVMLQRRFTSQPRWGRIVNSFTMKRMGWKDSSEVGDVRDRWPFYFLFKKALKKYKGFRYLDKLNSGFEIDRRQFNTNLDLRDFIGV